MPLRIILRPLERPNTQRLGECSAASVLGPCTAGFETRAQKMAKTAGGRDFFGGGVPAPTCRGDRVGCDIGNGVWCVSQGVTGVTVCGVVHCSLSVRLLFYWFGCGSLLQGSTVERSSVFACSISLFDCFIVAGLFVCLSAWLYVYPLCACATVKLFRVCL